MSNVSFQHWSGMVRRFYVARHQVADCPALDQDSAYDAWKSGVAAATYAATLIAPPPMAIPTPAPAPSPPSASVPPAPGWSRPAQDDGKPARAMWTLTAIVMVLGVLCAAMYAGNDLSSVRVFGVLAFWLDVPACILALVCLSRPTVRTQGFVKLAWEIAVVASLYYLSVGLDREARGTFKAGYAQGGVTGEKGGYEDGYHDGFNAGAERQLSHDRAVVGGY